MPLETPRWGVVLFAARETPDAMRQTIAAAQLAVAEQTTIDVLVNGNASLATAVVALLAAPKAAPANGRLRVWSIPHGDKANAWNQYVHHIWAAEELVFFVDGYARVQPDALQLLGNAVMGSDFALGGSGVPTVGWSADVLRANMLKNGGMHGNLCCVKGTALASMKQRGIRLPVGLYRTDSLMETWLVYDLDPIANKWDDARVLVHGRATWGMDEGRVWHPSSVLAHWRRKLRQAQGNLEMRAFKDFFVTRPQLPERLPATSRALVANWMVQCPGDARASLRGHPLRQWAWHRLQQQPDAQPQNLLPTLVWE